LPLWAWLGINFGWFKKQFATKYISISVVIAMVFCTWARVADWHTHFSEGTWLSSRETQQHLDALFFGVFLNFWQLTQPEWIKNIINSLLGKWITPLLAVILIGFGLYFYGEAKEMGIHNGTLASGLGYTILYIGYGLMIMVMLYHDAFIWFLGLEWVQPLIRFMAWIGFYSYSLYLWHQYMYFITKKIMGFTPLHDANNLPGFCLGLILSIVVAVFTTHTLEKYFLNIRNKLFPSA
jgi:peptidoglycan/LPS O-acetylase OafA/YrhL